MFLRGKKPQKGTKGYSSCAFVVAYVLDLSPSEHDVSLQRPLFSMLYFGLVVPQWFEVFRLV
jgi:hypothetical protein